MSILVVDASVALKWVVEEDGSEAAVALAAQPLAAPTLLLVECANVLWVKLRRGELTPSETVERWQALREAPVELVPAAGLLDHALDLAIQLAQTVYDCLYLALAIRLDGQLVTADRRLADATRRDPGLSGRVRLLGDEPPAQRRSKR
jgi:predicted nucleic acid-binding protein